MSGILIALVILLIWSGSLIFSLLVDIVSWSTLGTAAVVLGRTFIHTGLFIVAHDAMHGSVFPGNRSLNHWVGRLAITLYAFLPYRKCTLKHWHHHHQPGQPSDPDFHDDSDGSMWAWYRKFMTGYLDCNQKIVLLLGMGASFCILAASQIPIPNLLLFWVMPIVLSSMQLFFFGTYLPHRSPVGGYLDSHRAVSSNYPLFLSFITCYHFGYHWEHHEYPSLPWYKLPEAYRNSAVATRV